jgi:DnaK suppressor protein
MLAPERLERLRRALIEERDRLRSGIGDTSPESLATEENVGTGNHQAEDATAAFDQASLLSLRRGQEFTLDAVEHALHRIERGTFGVCERCGQEIDFSRLKAKPHAALCMACQRVAELE